MNARHSISEVAELIARWDADQCAPVAGRLRALVNDKITDPGVGPCGDDCACQAAAATGAVTVPLIACTLSADEATERVAAWQRLLARTVGGSRSEVAVDGGIVLRFPPDPELAAQVAALAAAEQSCCAFFTFTMRIDHTGTELTVTAPPDAAPLVEAMFGASE